jgi:hypothetical protein
MFSRIRAYDLRSQYMSRYSYMIDSKDPVSVANAEACRLASQAWQDIAQFSQRPDLQDDQGNPIEYDYESTIADILSRWEDYCRTGVVISDVDELAQEFRDKHALKIKAMEARNKALVSNTANLVPDAPPSISENKTTQTSSEKRKTSKKSTETVSIQSQVASDERSETPVERIDEENRKNIQLDALDYIVAEIRSEMSTDREEAELSIR